MAQGNSRLMSLGIQEKRSTNERPHPTIRWYDLRGVGAQSCKTQGAAGHPRRHPVQAEVRPILEHAPQQAVGVALQEVLPGASHAKKKEEQAMGLKRLRFKGEEFVLVNENHDDKEG